MDTATIIHSQRFDGLSAQEAAGIRKEGKETADKFEAIFLKQMVVKMRENASLGEGGMFGDGPGSDTYSQWFDSNMSSALSGSGQIGISKVLMTEFERVGAIPTLEQAEANTAKKGRTDVIA